MGWLKYGDSTAPPHNCDIPKADNDGDIWQCDNCLQVYRVEAYAPSGFLCWYLLGFSDYLKSVGMLHPSQPGHK